jgi:predicted methyltransferase
VEVILRLALLLVAAAGLLASGCGTQRGGDSASPPRETLAFFGVRPEMTVVEVWPGSGYTEILAPLLKQRGRLYEAHLDPASSEYARRTVEEFRAKLTARPDLYDKVVLTTLAAPPATSDIAPAGTADMAVTFGTLHNWMMFGWQREAFAAMHTALKPGGVLGVVEHRGDSQRPQDPKAASGYVNEQYAIELIESVGFKLVGRSEINANRKDTKDYEKGVWALPPTFAAGAKDREHYVAIGESDRFTLKFVKVAR